MRVIEYSYDVDSTEFLSTTSVDLDGVNALLTTEASVETVYENGEKTVVIGDNGLGKTIAVTIIGGVVQAASDNTIPTEEVNDGTQDCREVHYDDRPGEGIRDHVINNNDKPIDSLDLLELVISDPSAVGSGDDLLYYIRQMSNGKYAVVKVWKESGIVNHFPGAREFLKRVSGVVEYWATTTLTTTSDEWFDTLEDAKDAAENSADGEGDEINDWNDDPSGC